MHEDTLDDDTTHEIRPPRLLPPVQRPEDLPREEIEEGTLCLVSQEGGDEQLWAYRQGDWEPAGTP